MTVDVQALRRAVSPDQLIAIMVHPIPTPSDMPEIDAVVDLLKMPSVLFGPDPCTSGVEARCRYLSWGQVADYLDIIERRYLVSVTYVRHLLHLAAHFAERFGLMRAGPAMLTILDHEEVISARYDLPVSVSHEEAHRHTMAFWSELAYVDLLQPPFLFQFVEQAGDGRMTTCRAGGEDVRDQP